MRPLRRRTAALTAAALITTGLALSTEVRGTPEPTPVAVSPVPPRAGAAADRTGAAADRSEAIADRHGRGRERLHAYCRTKIKGSHATAYCQNPNPEPDRVQLHIECEHWWDIDADSAPVELLPAGYVQLSDRCWKEIRSVWVSHAEPLRPAPSHS
ncbi:hypothetical protein [Streptomyces sp. NPDC051569]|uniref:hypothetical protein n=1 Tax=Streptomyces sp. NPDC051569 TaxID=3365661 RepID=UPI0037B8AFCC